MQERTIAIYSRKSKFTGKGESIGNQVELCREYIRNVFGREAAEGAVVFEDEGFSGGDMKRPAFQRMMTQVRKGSFRAIAVYRLDRISRNISDFSGLIEELTRLHVSFVSIREQFDTGTPMGRAMMYIISVFSQLERETIAERNRDNMHELAKTGRWLGGNTPTGYASQSISQVTLDGKTRKACRLALIPEEARLVREIFDLYDRLDSLTAVETQLLRQGAKTRQGKDFSRFDIKAMLQNPVYMVADREAWAYFAHQKVDVFSEEGAFDGSCGIIAYNRTDQEKGKATVYLPMEQWIIAVGKHPGIVPSGQWIRVNRSMERNKSAAYRKPRSNGALLTGRFFCACGSRMYPKLTGRRTPKGEAAYAYVCKAKERSQKAQCSCHNLEGNRLDEAVLAWLERLPWCRQTFLDRLERHRQDLWEDSGSRALSEELRRNEKKLAGLVEALGLLEEPAARSRVADRIEALTRTNEALRQQLKTGENTLEPEAVSALAEALGMWPKALADMPPEEKRRVVCSVVKQVIWDGTRARMTLGGTGERVSAAGGEEGPDRADKAFR